MGIGRQAITSYGLAPLGVIVGWRDWPSVNLDMESNLALTDCIDDRLQQIAVSIYEE